MIWRAFYLVLCGLFLAGIVHVAVILLIPEFGSKDAARQIVGSDDLLRFELINDDTGIRVGDADPFFRTAVCRFDLSQNGVRIEGPKIAEFWSASVFDKRGRIVYSLNNRSAINNVLKMLVVSPIQMADIRELQPEEIETSILVEMPDERGFVILRTLVRDGSFEGQARDFLNKVSCEPYVTR